VIRAVQCGCLTTRQKVAFGWTEKNLTDFERINEFKTCLARFNDCCIPDLSVFNQFCRFQTACQKKETCQF